jgi:hypothetical protein
MRKLDDLHGGRALLEQKKPTSVPAVGALSSIELGFPEESQQEAVARSEALGCSRPNWNRQPSFATCSTAHPAMHLYVFEQVDGPI